MRKEHLDATKKHDMLLFAIEVHHQYVLNFKKDNPYEEYVRISGKEMRKALSKDRCDYLCGNDRDVFLNYLDMYFGLRLAKKDDGIGRDYPPTLEDCFYVMIKK